MIIFSLGKKRDRERREVNGARESIHRSAWADVILLFCQHFWFVVHIEKQVFQLSPRFQPVVSFAWLQDIWLSRTGAGSGLLPFGLEAKQPFTCLGKVSHFPLLWRHISILRSLFPKILFLLETKKMARRWTEELSNINCIQVCVGWEEKGT